MKFRAISMCPHMSVDVLGGCPPRFALASMAPLRFSNGEDFFEMLVHIEEDSSLQSYGDAYVSARVASSGFAGHNDFWIEAEAFRDFAMALVELDRSFKG